MAMKLLLNEPAMYRIALLAVIAAALLATLHAAPEPPKTASSGAFTIIFKCPSRHHPLLFAGSRASPAAAPSGAASQTTIKPTAAAPAAAAAAAAAPAAAAPAQPKSDATPATAAASYIPV
jgi:hypothetical protein